MEVPLLLSDFLRRAEHLYPNKLAIECGSDRESYREFGERVNRLANPLRFAGIGKGDRVAILSPNCHRFLESFYGVTAIGAVLVPLNYRLTPADFVYIVNHSEARAFLVDWELAPVVRQLENDLGTVQDHILLAPESEQVPAGWRSYEQIVAAASAGPPPEPNLDENDLATVDADRYINIVDRAKDVIISGGGNISSIEVEDVLYKHPAVWNAPSSACRASNGERR